MIIRLEDLSYTYPGSDSAAIERIILTVNEGEFVLIAGPSGSGKSTLLRCLNGLIPHFSGGDISGRVEVAGLDPIKHGPVVLSREVGFVFQDPESQMVLDEVESEVAFSLENEAVPPKEIQKRVDEILDLLKIEHLRRRRLQTLSGGERQLVAIASSMISKPRILALDEPTSQLDPASANQFLELLSSLNQKLGLTILLVEHRIERIMQFASRYIYLEKGRIKIDAPVADGIRTTPFEQQPPLARLSGSLGWKETPVSTKEARNVMGEVRVPRKNGSTDRLKLAIKPSPHKSLAYHVENLRFAYGKKFVLRGITFSIGHGDSVGIIGPNGSGKSTLLKCMIGLLKTDQGQIVLDGKLVTGRSVPDICQITSYLPQAPDDLLFADSVTAELEFTLANRSYPMEARNGAIEQSLAELSLTNLANAYPRDLSVGQRQRVALGAVTVSRPKVILLDEPTRGLDPKAKSKLIELFRSWQQAGLALVLVTHDIELAARVTDRIIFLQDGIIQRDGPTKEVLSDTNLFGTQISEVFPGTKWITVNDALGGLGLTENVNT